MNQTEREKRFKVRARNPERLEVYMLNDDITTMDFVVDILIKVFFYTQEKAYETMLKIDREGEAYIGTYEASLAKSKVASVERRARAEGFPLKCRLEIEKV